MRFVYCVMVHNKFEREGILSSGECYDSLEKAQEFCQNRYDTRKVNEMYYTSENYDYKIHVLSVK